MKSNIHRSYGVLFLTGLKRATRILTSALYVCVVVINNHRFFLSNHVLYKLSSANYKYMYWYIIILDARFLHVYLKIHVCLHHLQSLAIVTTVLMNYACILFIE